MTDVIKPTLKTQGDCMDYPVIPSEAEFKTYLIMAEKASKSPFFSKMGGEGGILSIILFARELGLPPMQCLFGGTSNINGKIEISARLMNSMIRNAGHKLNIRTSTHKIC